MVSSEVDYNKNASSTVEIYNTVGSLLDTITFTANDFDVQYLSGVAQQQTQTQTVRFTLMIFATNQAEVGFEKISNYDSNNFVYSKCVCRCGYYALAGGCGGGGRGGPDAWYYPDSDDTYGSSILFGNAVTAGDKLTCASAGTITKVSFRLIL